MERYIDMPTLMLPQATRKKAPGESSHHAAYGPAGARILPAAEPDPPKKRAASRATQAPAPALRSPLDQLTPAPKTRSKR